LKLLSAGILVRAVKFFSVATIIALFSALFGLPQPAFALDKLTEQNITEFIEKTSDIIAGNAGDMTPEDIRAYLDKHLDERAFFSSSISYAMPGMPPQETGMSLEKEEFIASLEQGKQALSDYSNKVSIKNIAVSSDGTKATVETIGNESGTMIIEDVAVPVEGKSSCLQILMLGDDGVIKMYSANCTTTVRFKD
jgi:hypothetical protein